MSLRYRLFLWVSGLFIVVSVCSYFMENFVANRELKKAQLLLRQEILTMSEKRRDDMQNFLAVSIAEDEIKVDAILNNISSFSPEALRFGPTQNNLMRGTWGDSVDLLLDYKWIDFIQNTNQNQVTAAIIPEQTVMHSFYQMDIDQDLSWVFTAEEATPYLAVRLPYFLTGPSEQIQEKITGLIPTAYLFFNAEELKKIIINDAPILQDSPNKSWPPIPVKWTQGFELDTTSFVASFDRARRMMQKGELTAPSLSRDQLKEKLDGLMHTQDGKFAPIPQETLLAPIAGGESTQKRFEEIALRYTQINMLWVVIAMYDSGIFGNHLFSFPAPSGGVVFAEGRDLGVGIQTKDVLFQNKIFEDEAYYSRNIPHNSNDNLATSLAVIYADKSSEVFIGNTAKFTINEAGKEKVGYLTLGVNADQILQKLVLALRQTALLVHNGRPLGGYSANNEKIAHPENIRLPFAQMLEEKSGLVSLAGENDYFMHLQPFPGVDLHFFLFNPEAKEFALLNDLETGSSKVVDAIRLDIHLAGLLALCIMILVLHNIARNITRPIQKLAIVSNQVAEGGLDKVQLPLSITKHDDEIALLCRSFEAMIKGLQEKEKVRGVLNKVVSPEIAEEILKGNIHLGGEEKKVTVFFADIRNFTKLTQEMAPQHVIDLLNTCMTKISNIVDKNNGVIDKYVGDEAMALFGAPLERADDAFHAIKSGLEIIQAIKEWNQERALKGEPPIEMGFGIHTGDVLAGNMGAENRLNYTVIGSSVNLAARLCSSAKGMEILITQHTLEEPFIKERVSYEPLGSLTFKGFDHPIEVFRITGLV